MPKIPVDEAPAGPAMDAAVAEALGWRQLSYRLWHDNNGRERWIDNRDGAWSPSTDIAAAWGLWSCLCAEWHYAKLTFVRDLHVQASLYRNAEAVQYAAPTITATAQNGYLAICRAFLKGNGVEYVEVPE